MSEVAKTPAKSKRDRTGYQRNKPGAELSGNVPPGTTRNPEGISSRSHNLKMSDEAHRALSALPAQQRGELVMKALGF